MSVASEGGNVAAFSVYRTASTTSTPLDAIQRRRSRSGIGHAAVLPPLERKSSEVATLLADAELGLPTLQADLRG